MAGGTHLELEERERLAALKAEGLSPRAIARALGRAASTVSRELRRNAPPQGGHPPGDAAGGQGGAPCRCTPRAAPASAASGRPSWSATSGSAASCVNASWKGGRPSR